jgi:hypothetical protein
MKSTPCSIGVVGFFLACMLVSPSSSLWSANTNAGLVGHWSFDEASGWVAADTSTLGNHGLIVDPSWTDGKFGSALSFRGGDFVDLAKPASLQPNSITVSAWIKSFDGGMIFRIFGFGLGLQLGAGDNFGAPGKLSFWTWGTSKTGVTSAQSYDDGQWHFVAGTFGDSLVSLYIDGSLIGSAPGSIVYRTSRITIGADGGVDNYFRGAIDDVRIYNRVLPAAEIQELYAGIVSTAPPPEPDPTPLPSIPPGFPIPATLPTTPTPYPAPTPTPTTPIILSNGATWADSWSGVHSFVVFAPRRGVSESFISSIASRYDFGWSTPSYQALINGNPNFISSAYSSATQGGQDLGWYQANHPDWILYACDRVTPILQFYYGAVTLDITNPEVIDYKFNELTSAAAVAWDNFFLDNSFPAPSGGYTHACGAYDRDGSWVQKFAGVGSYAEVLDPQWTDAMIAYAAAIRKRLHDLPVVPKLLIPNASVQIVAGDPVRSANLIAAVDGFLIEGGQLSQAATGDPRQLWLRNIHFIETANAAGRAYYSVEFADAVVPKVTNLKQYVQFTLASYLLAKGHTAALDIIPPGANGGYDNSDGIFWPAEFQAATAIGTPCGPMRQVAGVSGTEDGLFIREHTGGVSIVNPSRANWYATVLPAGNSYQDLYGATVTSPTILLPSSGVVLLKTNPGSCSN